MGDPRLEAHPGLPEASVTRRRTRSPITVLTALAGVALCSSTLAGCLGGPTATPDPPESELRTFVRTLTPGDVVLWLSSSSYDHHSEGRLVRLSGSGQLNTLTVAPMEGGQVLIPRRDRLVFTSDRITFDVNHTQVTPWARGGQQGDQYWSAIRPDGTWVTAFNTGFTAGGYATDVHWQGNGSPVKHSVVPAPPGASGLGPDAFWTIEMVDDDEDPEVTLFRTDLASAKTAPWLRWRHWRDPGSSRTTTFTPASNLFHHRNQLHFLELYAGVTRDGRYVGLRGDDDQQLRLASIDLRTRTYESTRVRTLDGGLTERGSHPSALANAAARGVRIGDRLITVDYDGNIVSVSLESGHATNLARVSAEARHAGEAVVSWEHGELAVLALPRDRTTPGVVERYSLNDGRRISSAPVPVELGQILSTDGLSMWSMAIVPE